MNKLIPRSLPSFYVNAADHIHLLHEPKQFHSYLIDSIEKAQHRIFISALYIGKEETEFISKLHNALATRPNLRLDILLDGLRSTREYPSTTAASLISTLQSNFPKQTFAHFYHTPDLVGLRKRIVPRRFDEGWGLWHAKIFGFDDTVVMSGANLSRDYFTNRQDRYWIFKENKELADFMHGLVRKCSEFSMRLDSSSNTLYWPSSSSSPTIPSPLDNPTQFRHHAYHSLSNFLQEQVSLSEIKNAQNSKEKDTLIRPFIQMGPLGIRQEFNLVVPAMINAASNWSSLNGKESEAATLDWTSGYFSLDRAYKHLLINQSLSSSKSPNIRVLCASPSANGFLNSRGLSNYIPPAYTFLEHKFWKEIQRKQRNDTSSSSSFELKEWSRPGWTYHAKGLWVTPASGRMPLSHSDIESSLWMPPCEYNNQPTISPATSKNPVATIIGSSNYGPRSINRDMEINFLITTLCPNLQQNLANELQNLNRDQWTEIVCRDTFARSDRTVPLGVKIATWLIRDML